MQPFPHHYQIHIDATPSASLSAGGVTLPPLAVDSPSPFGGPGDQWSPEELLLAALGNCYALSFRALAQRSGLAWQALTVDVEGVLDSVERVMRFTAATLQVRLTLPTGADPARAERLLQRAEAICIVANSLNFTPTLAIELAFA